MKEAVALMNENSLGGSIFFYITVFYLVISVWTFKRKWTNARSWLQNTDRLVEVMAQNVGDELKRMICVTKNEKNDNTRGIIKKRK